MPYPEFEPEQDREPQLQWLEDGINFVLATFVGAVRETVVAISRWLRR